MTALHALSIAQAGAALRDGSVTSVALTEDALARIAAIDPSLDSFITVTAERARADAAAADAAFASGVDHGPMQGVPYALKDIYDTAGIRTTCHSKLRADTVPEADSVVAAKFKAAGGVLLGKLATHEFALGGPSFDLPFPPARNPWNRDHMPGGSSSGSGAAVAAGLVRMAMGSDTGGSIRGPAGYCGTVGLKPTYGLVSRRGVFPLSTTLDHCGPLSWTVEDSAISMGVIAGYDPLDPASADVAVPDFSGRLHEGVRGLRIGLPRHFYATAEGVSAEVVSAIDQAAETLGRLGATVEEITLPDYELFNACGRVIMFTEARHRDGPAPGDAAAAGAVRRGEPPTRVLRRADHRQRSDARASLGGHRPRQPAELPDPDHGVQRHRQPRAVRPDRVLRVRAAAVDADRRPRLRRRHRAAHRCRVRGGDRAQPSPPGAGSRLTASARRPGQGLSTFQNSGMPFSTPVSFLEYAVGWKYSPIGR